MADQHLESADLAHGISVPARTIPWPSSISPKAREIMRAIWTHPHAPLLGDGTDVAAWERHIAQSSSGMAAFVEARCDPTFEIVTRQIDGVTVHISRPPGSSPSDKRVYLEIHGGALIAGGGAYARASAAIIAQQHKVEAISIDYRMPPRHPYPAALDDCLAVYRASVLERGPENVVVGGGSAGGNLAAALMLRARMEGLPRIPKSDPVAPCLRRGATSPCFGTSPPFSMADATAASASCGRSRAMP